MAMKKLKLFAFLKTIACNVLSKLQSRGHGSGALGTYTGVLIPTCENMWGVLIFLRFFYIVGNAGVWQTFVIVFISFCCAILTTMSVSAIATNGPIAEGGTYYLISRALGPKLGGAVGLLYYLGVVLLSVLEVLGSIEMIVFTFPTLSFEGSNRVIASTILIALGLLVFFGIKFVSKLSLVFFTVVQYTMLSYYLGLGLAPRKSAPTSLTGLSWATFQSNWSPRYLPGQSFSSAVALFFPCFTGILSGVDRATNLKQPDKSIPQGTLGAVVVSLMMYMSYMGLWAAVAERDYLVGNHSGQAAMLLVVKDVGFPLAILTQIGIIIVSMSQAMQCLIVSPRLLQAIAIDGVVPFLEPLAKTSNNGEPQKALMVTTVICVLFAMMGSLNAVAPLVSICFLTCYSALNLSCLVFSTVNAPSWRPRWKYYHWSAALFGFMACVAMNFVIVWYWALVAIILLICMYMYIDFRQVEVNWGTALGGLCHQIAVQGILSVGHEARYTVNWRPQLLCLSKPRSSWTEDGHAGHEFLLFTSQLKKGQGLCVVTVILEGKLEEMSAQVAAEKIELENRMAEADVMGFAKVMVAPTYREGKSYAIQSSGLGSLEPNTLILGWPMKWRDESNHEDSSEILLETLSECRAVDKAVLLCMHLKRFPINNNVQEGAIDVWWIVHDGGLLLLLAHLLQQHKIWRKCKLRVHTVAEKLDNSNVVKKNLEKLLDLVRIEAEVQVLELDESCLAPYTFDYTIRVEEAKAYAQELAKYRKSAESGGGHADNASRHTAGIRAGSRQSSGDKKSKGNSEDEATPDSQRGERQKEMRRGSLGVPALNVDNLVTEKDIANDEISTLEHLSEVKSSSSRLQGAAPVIPPLVPILDHSAPGTSKSSPAENSSLHPAKNFKRSIVESSIPEGEAMSKFSPTDIDQDHSTLMREVRSEAHSTHSKNLAASRRPNLHISVDEASIGDFSAGDFDLSGTSRDLEGQAEPEGSQRCSSQMYPGSPAGSKLSVPRNLPEPMQRTWETFSQSYSPAKLNSIIVEQSGDARMVLINLPDHYKGMQPRSYMEYCEELCQGLDRVLLVHGTGKELWGGQAQLGL